ncbi:hypothetical protein BH11MYX1_BH11MYX1_23980 [soil metagenome]
MSELADPRGHYIAAGNAVLGLGALALLLALLALVFGASSPPGLAQTGGLFVVVGSVLRRSW